MSEQHVQADPGKLMKQNFAMMQLTRKSQKHEKKSANEKINPFSFLLLVYNQINNNRQSLNKIGQRITKVIVEEAF